MKTTNDIGRLLFRYLRSELTTRQAASLKSWRKSDPLNEQLFVEETNPDRLRTVITRMRKSKEIVYQKIREQLPDLPDLASGNRFSIRPKVFRIAAIFIVVIGAGLFFLLNGSNTKKPSEPEKLEDSGSLAYVIAPPTFSSILDEMRRGWNDGSAGIRFRKNKNGETVYNASNNTHAAKDEYYFLYTPANGHICLKLPDSTLIWLNKSSSIRYPANFTIHPIRVYIEGEAYVQVRQNSKSPFEINLWSSVAARGMQPSTTNRQPSTVNRQPLELETTGGIININTTTSDSMVRATLLQGNLKVLIQPAMGKTPTEIQILPGQQLIWGVQKSDIIQAAHIDSIVAWKKWK